MELKFGFHYLVPNVAAYQGGVFYDFQQGLGKAFLICADGAITCMSLLHPKDL